MSETLLTEAAESVEIVFTVSELFLFVDSTDARESFEAVFTESFISAIDAVNIDINKHNEKTKNFSQAKTKATTKLENHYLSEIYDDVKILESDIKKLKEEIERGKPNICSSFDSRSQYVTCR